MKYNFSDVLILNGKTTRFLRFYNDEDSTKTIYCTTTFYETTGSTNSNITINDCPIEDISEECITLESSKEIAVKLEYDGLEKSSAVLLFTIGENEGSPNGSPSGSPTSEEKTLVIYALQEEKSKTNIDLNNLPISSKIKYDQKTSYLLMRTNPALTGNVKLTIDSESGISLNSIDANANLKNTEFKNYKVSYLSSYQKDVCEFANKINNKEIFYSFTENDYTAAKKNYYEENNDIYSYGVSQCNSQYYSEEFSMFAPLWLTKNIPEYFVIFRAKHSISKESYNSNANNKIFSELINDAEIIKTYDLRENSKVGNYIRNLINDNGFTDKPITVNFGNEDVLKINGIALDSYVISSKINSNTSYTEEKTLKEFEGDIVGSFKNNGMIACNILNMEFLFDDTESDEYSINRYFGLYLDAIELGTCAFSNELLALVNADEQYPTSVVGETAECYSIVPFTQYNDKGIILPIPNKMIQPSGEDVCNESRIFAIKDKDNKFHRLKESTAHYDNNGDIDYYNFRLYDTQLDITKLCGIYNVKFSGHADLNSETSAQMQLTLYDTNGDGYIFNPGDKISIYLRNNGDIIEKYTMIANETDINTGDCWKFPVYDSSDNCIKGMFNPKGTVYQVAQSISRCINAFDTLYFRAINIDNNVAIVCREKNESGNAFTIEKELTDECVRNNCKFFDSETCDSINFCGGNKTKNNNAIITEEQAKSLQDNIYFQVQSGKFSKIKNFGSDEMPILSIPDVSAIVYDGDDIVSIENYGEKRIVTIEDEVPFYTNNSSYITAYDIYTPTLSIMSLYPIKDFDFDFYSSDYADNRQEETDIYFNVINLGAGETAVLDDKEIYFVECDEFTSAKISDAYYEDGAYRDAVYKNGEYIETYSILNKKVEAVNGSIHISKYNYNAISSYSSFNFSGLGYDTEYDKLNENSMSKYAFNSKIIPTYVKWVSEGTDVRDNNYRLNFSNAFGKLNFSPSTDPSSSSSDFTYEWLYLNNFPKNIKVTDAAKAKSYIYGSLDDVVGKDTYYTLEKLLLDKDVDYFTKFLVKGYNHTSYNGSKDYLRERYTFCNYIEGTNVVQTLFHGIKLNINEIDKNGNTDNDAKHYDGYKFSAILSELDTDSDKAYECTLYDNKTFKTLLFVMRVPLQGDAFKNSLSYTDLYNSSSFYDFCNLTGEEDSFKTDIQYADVKQYSTLESLRTPAYTIYYSNVLYKKYGINVYEINNANYGNENTMTSSGFPSYAWVGNGVTGFALNHGNTVCYPGMSSVNIDYISDFDTTITCSSSGYGFASNNSTIVRDANIIKIGGGKNANFVYKLLSMNNIRKILENGFYTYKTNNKKYTPQIKIIDTTTKTITNTLYTEGENVPTSINTPYTNNYLVYASTNSNTLYRHSGMYKPKFKNVVEFSANTSENLSKKFGIDFLLCNTDIFNDADSFVINNYQYNKVGNNSLTSDDSYNSGALYDLPAANEISVDKKDRAIAKSNWDAKYYSNYTSSNSYDLVSGIEDKTAKESKSFFGSKVMNVPMSLEFYSYSIDDDEYEIAHYNNIESNSKNTNSTNSQITSNDYDIIRFDIKRILLNKMYEQGLMNEINWAVENVITDFNYMTEDERKSYMKNYYESNIMNLYKISSIEVYAKTVKQEECGFIENGNYNMTIYQGYDLVTIANAPIYEDDLNFSMQINQGKAKYYSYIIHIKMERI